MEKLAHGTLSSPVAPPNPRASSTIPGRAGPRERRARWHEAPARARPKALSGASAARSALGLRRAGSEKRGEATRPSIRWKFPHSIQGFQFRPEPVVAYVVGSSRRSVLQARARRRCPFGRGYRLAHGTRRARRASLVAPRTPRSCTAAHGIGVPRPAGLTPNFTPVAKSKDDRAVEGPLLRPLGPLIQAGVGADRRRQLRKRVQGVAARHERGGEGNREVSARAVPLPRPRP